MGRTIAVVWVYGISFLLPELMFFLWYRWSGSLEFALLVLLLPVLYGYIGPGIATNLLGKWRFKGPLLLGNYYPHHGLIYASDMMPLLFPAFLGTPQGVLSKAVIVRILLCTAALHGYVLWLHDILILRCGMVEILSPPPGDRSPDEIATSYAPASFFAVGLSYAAGALIAYQRIVIAGDDSIGTFLKLLGVGLFLLLTVPSIVYGIAEKIGGRS